MATQNDNGIRSFAFASAITANTLVNISGDNAAQAASTGANAIGVVQNDVAAGAQGAVKLFLTTRRKPHQPALMLSESSRMTSPLVLKALSNYFSHRSSAS